MLAEAVEESRQVHGPRLPHKGEMLAQDAEWRVCADCAREQRLVSATAAPPASSNATSQKAPTG